jgi:hypothetical protein
MDWPPGPSSRGPRHTWPGESGGSQPQPETAMAERPRTDRDLRIPGWTELGVTVESGRGATPKRGERLRTARARDRGQPKPGGRGQPEPGGLGQPTLEGRERTGLFGTRDGRSRNAEEGRHRTVGVDQSRAAEVNRGQEVWGNHNQEVWVNRRWKAENGPGSSEPGTGEAGTPRRADAERLGSTETKRSGSTPIPRSRSATTRRFGSTDAGRPRTDRALRNPGRTKPEGRGGPTPSGWVRPEPQGNGCPTPWGLGQPTPRGRGRSEPGGGGQPTPKGRERTGLFGTRDGRSRKVEEGQCRTVEVERSHAVEGDHGHAVEGAEATGRGRPKQEGRDEAGSSEPGTGRPDGSGRPRHDPMEPACKSRRKATRHGSAGMTHRSLRVGIRCTAVVAQKATTTGQRSEQADRGFGRGGKPGRPPKRSVSPSCSGTRFRTRQSIVPTIPMEWTGALVATVGFIPCGAREPRGEGSHEGRPFPDWTLRRPGRKAMPCGWTDSGRPLVEIGLLRQPGRDRESL